MFRLIGGILALAMVAFSAGGVSVGHASGKTAGKCRTSTTASKKSGTHTIARSSSAPVFVFGVTGGNIRPWSVSIDADGTVQSDGIGVRDKKPVYPTDTLDGLITLATAEGFWSMPSVARCSGTLPDIASRFVQITSNTGTTRVTVHGGCNSSFNQLWANLAAVADIGG